MSVLFRTNLLILTKCSKIDPVLIFITLLTIALVTIFIIPDKYKKLYEGLKRKLVICGTWLVVKSKNYLSLPNQALSSVTDISQIRNTMNICFLLKAIIIFNSLYGSIHWCPNFPANPTTFFWDTRYKCLTRLFELSNLM